MYRELLIKKICSSLAHHLGSIEGNRCYWSWTINYMLSLIYDKTFGTDYRLCSKRQLRALLHLSDGYRSVSWPLTNISDFCLVWTTLEISAQSIVLYADERSLGQEILERKDDRYCVCVCVCVPTNVFAVVKWADGFSDVPRNSSVLGRTISGSTFRWHLSHLFLDLFLLLVSDVLCDPIDIIFG